MVNMLRSISRQQAMHCLYVAQVLGSSEADAVATLDLGLTQFKEMKSMFGIKRWPCREIRSVERLIADVEGGAPVANQSVTLAELRCAGNHSCEQASSISQAAGHCAVFGTIISSAMCACVKGGIITVNMIVTRGYFHR
jgi:hypothetical protein